MASITLAVMVENLTNDELEKVEKQVWDLLKELELPAGKITDCTETDREEDEEEEETED